MPVHACAPTVAFAGKYLSVRARYFVGAHAEIATHCDLLSVWTQPYGLRLFDPHTGVMTATLPADADVMRDEALAGGALVLWSDRSLHLVDRVDLEPRWYIPRTSRGRVFTAGNWVIEGVGQDTIIARDGATGRERWRRSIATEYESVDEIDGKLIARLHDRGVEALDETDGHVLWHRSEYVTIAGKYVVVDISPRLIVLDADGHERAQLRGAHDRVEAMAADGDVFFLATGSAGEYGGLTTVAIEGIELSTQRRVWSATAKHAMRRHASTPPQLWVIPKGPIHYYEVDNGFLTTFDRTSGKPLDTLGVANSRELMKTPTGFASVTDEGVVSIIEPSDAESPPMEKMHVEGVLTLDGKPMPNIEVVVGHVLTKTGAGGRYSATLDARGHFSVRVKQPTSEASVAYWPGADTVVEADGRTGSYVVNLAAHRDYLE